MTGRSEVHARLGADRTAEILAAGRRLSPSETVDFARALAAELLSSADSSPAPTALHGLTPREAEVLRLIAAGRSNQQIGEALFISPRTAQNHVTHVLAKLGLPVAHGRRRIRPHPRARLIPRSILPS